MQFNRLSLLGIVLIAIGSTLTLTATPLQLSSNPSFYTLPVDGGIYPELGFVCIITPTYKDARVKSVTWILDDSVEYTLLVTEEYPASKTWRSVINQPTIGLHTFKFVITWEAPFVIQQIGDPTPNPPEPDIVQGTFTMVVPPPPPAKLEGNWFVNLAAVTYDEQVVIQLTLDNEFRFVKTSGPTSLVVRVTWGGAAGTGTKLLVQTSATEWSSTVTFPANGDYHVTLSAVAVDDAFIQTIVLQLKSPDAVNPPLPDDTPDDPTDNPVPDYPAEPLPSEPSPNVTTMTMGVLSIVAGAFLVVREKRKK